MKIIHLSDLHIGVSLINKNLLDDQKYILEKIVDIAVEEKPDAVIIAGDVYDKAMPSAEAVSVFDGFITSLSEALPEAEIMVISGNHDNIQRINIFRNILSSHRIHMVGKPPENPDEYIEKVTLSDDYGDVNFYLLPFIKPSYVKKITGENLSYNDSVHKMIERENIDISARNVLVSHQYYVRSGESPENTERMESETVTVGNIDSVTADILDIFDYSALGHLHKPSHVNNEFQRYCGTPLAVSFSEAEQKKGVIIVEMGGKGDIKTSVRELVPMRKLKVIRGAFLEMTADKFTEDFVSLEITDRSGMKKGDAHRELKSVFPNLLEIKMNNIRENNYSRKSLTDRKKTDVFEMCCSFLNNPSKAEMAVIQEIINSLGEDTEI
ncbi:MAG: exonuclease SbcCD subunit D [Ruminococcus sp.]|nr:exonuclease SbcCD subunit D [Ruminococcus sp.]